MGDVASRVVRFLVHEGWKDKLARINTVEKDVERNVVYSNGRDLQICLS